MDLKDWRENYDKYHLREKDVTEDPFSQFTIWFERAIEDKNIEPNAMVLTTSHDDFPDSRVVLLKEVKDRKFCFYTNYDSKKGHEIEKNPNVMLLFYWNMSQRQVRINGKVSKMSREEAVSYFDSRPNESKISAIASPQSQKITLDQLENNVKTVIEANKLECPQNWGGYAVEPNYFEFWQGQPGRLHDRIVYEKKSNNNWEIYRLAP